MTIVRIADFPELQAALIKSMYKQVRGRFNDGTWRDFKADITINGQRFNFECRFKLDNFFLTLGRREVRDGNNNIVAPNEGIFIPTC